MLEQTGVPTISQIESAFPPPFRLKSGPVAIIECFQPIPCNPCATSCPRQAIHPLKNINDLPVINYEKCNGCGICLLKCPGLAIMVVDMDWTEHRALFKLPYEFHPLPEKGQRVQALDRSGNPVCEAFVEHVVQTANKTAIVSVSVDKNMIKTVRNINVPSDDIGMPCYNTDQIEEKDPEDETIICRCADITIKDLRGFVADGLTSIDELKRLTRIGMGQCQGRTCIPLVIRELSRLTEKPIEELHPTTQRPMVNSIKLSMLCLNGDMYE